MDAPPAYAEPAVNPTHVAAVVLDAAPPATDAPPPVMNVHAVQASGASLEARLSAMQMELDLPEEIVRDLLSVGGTDIVVIADDSSSMNTVSDTTDYMRPLTRWGELRTTLSKLVHMLLVVDHSDGFALKFLNDPTWYQITSAAALDQVFQAKPAARGLTPLFANLQLIARGYTGGKNPESDTIVLILTDGQPSDAKMPQIQALLQGRAKSVYCTFVMCTEEDDVVEMYNKCVDPIWGCDISDDYKSEKAEVERAGKKLNENKWLAKIVLGGKMPKYDKMDEKAKMCCAVM